MIATNKLRAIFAEAGLSQKDVAIKLGMSTRTFYSKMKKGVFGTDEVELLMDIFKISDPMPIFFAKDVT